ncbi:hypothetical protein FS749_007262, partial [Ceratobasidium sp. UAMH 11750]
MPATCGLTRGQLYSGIGICSKRPAEYARPVILSPSCLAEFCGLYKNTLWYHAINIPSSSQSPISSTSPTMLSNPAIALFDVRDWVIVVTGSAVDITNPLATILAQTGAHVYVCQPFLSDNDVPGDLEYPGQTFINMDESNKMSIANAVRIIESRENHINLLINVNSEGSISRRTSWDSFFNKQQPHFLDSASQQTHEVEDWDRVFGTNISSSYFIAS